MRDEVCRLYDIIILKLENQNCVCSENRVHNRYTFLFLQLEVLLRPAIPLNRSSVLAASSNADGVCCLFVV
jgi:hypothetical protein